MCHPCHTRTFSFHTTSGYVIRHSVPPIRPFSIFRLCGHHHSVPLAGFCTTGSPGVSNLCATQYDSFMPLVLLTPSLLHHPAFVPLGLYATLLAFEPHRSSDPKPDHPGSFATHRLRFLCTLETRRLPFCLHWTNPSHARLKASGRGLEGEVLLRSESRTLIPGFGPLAYPIFRP